MSTHIRQAQDLPNDHDRKGLPAWSYFNTEMLEMEKDLLFRSHWQLVCHVNDLPEAGDFVTLDCVGERALVIRGQDGTVRGFHNLCRHRGSRVVGKEQGNCKGAIICPFHGWVYNLDGTLRGAAQPDKLPPLDPVAFGLKAIETDIWCGFVFVRFRPGPQPSMGEVMRRFDEELAQYDLDNLMPGGDGFYALTAAVNWKCVRDVDNEGYHVPMAHPGLHDLFGANYYDEEFKDGTSRSFSEFREADNRLWSVRAYTSILQPPEGLDDQHGRAWLYIGLFPNCVLGIYPDCVKFYQEFPLEFGLTMQRGTTYRLANEDRRMRLTRYLSERIDRLTSEEDEELVRWTWEAAFSSGYDGVILSDLENCVRSYHDNLRRHFPVLNEDEPAKGMVAARNAELLRRQAGTE
jgi:phenylpropionate dioxygenase-like ring-hydroxylating dioxygenase large terminal subunit